MWNASHVHKQSIKVWQEKMVDPTWNSVWGMFSTSLLWGRFWCSRTIQIVSKILPDCDISAVKRKIKWTTWRFLGLASSHFWKNWQVRHGDQPWYHKHWIGVFVGTWPIHAPGAPCKHSSKSSRHKTKPSTKQRKFYICADGPHTHTRHTRHTHYKNLRIGVFVDHNQQCVCVCIREFRNIRMYFLDLSCRLDNQGRHWRSTSSWPSSMLPGTVGSGSEMPPGHSVSIWNNLRAKAKA